MQYSFAGMFLTLGTLYTTAQPLHSPSISAVRLGGFWGARQATNRAVTIPYCFRRCEDTGRIANFRRAGGLESGPFQGIPFDDSDVYKVIEGAAYSLAQQPDPELDRYLDQLISWIAAAQEPDGYLYTARRLLPPERMPRMSGRERWSNLKDSHELYNVGHLYEAAVAHWQATGKTNLLDVALRNARLVASLWKPDGLGWPSGHEEIEIGLIRLFEATGDRTWLDTARHLMDLRGRPETHSLYGAYAQDHQPLLQQNEAVGHAVRAGYIYTAMARYAAYSDDPRWKSAAVRLWEDIVRHKLYITGGLGARAAGESFGDRYELPNEATYCETCAQIAGMLFCHALLQLDPDARYADVLERILYNAFLSGVSLSGDRFFYPNPLASDGRRPFNHGRPERQPWFGCACCPVNVARIMPQIGAWVYSTGPDAVYVHLFGESQAVLTVGGETVRVAQVTSYPWDGSVEIRIEPSRPLAMGLWVRIPGWVRNQPVPSDLYRYTDVDSEPPTARLNGQPLALDSLVRGYARWFRTWRAGDRVELNLPMRPRRVIAHAAVESNRDHVAIERGPIVYAIEGADHPGSHVRHLWLPPEEPLHAAFDPTRWNGCVLVRARAKARATTLSGEVTESDVQMLAIPYHLWCHRGPNEMTVWIPARREAARPLPPPTPASRARVSASHCHAHDTPDAVRDGIEPSSSGDGSIPRMTWWDHRGTPEWIQYEWDRPLRVTAVEVYWFDDTGRGACRVPASWRLLYRANGTWRPVAAKTPPGTELHRFNRLEFEPVTTDGLRIAVQLQPNFSGGILEWRVVESPEHP